MNAETAEKIRTIARDCGFQVSAVARGLATKRTLTVGVVVTTIADPFVAEVVSGIEERANASGYSVFLSDSNADPDRERNVVRSFAERRVDGIVVTSSRVGALYVPLLSEMQVPIVLVNNQNPREFVYSVMIENVQASREATNHLIALGHRRIAYLGDRFGYQSDTERFAGYRRALEEAGLPFIPELVVHGDGKAEGAMKAMEKVLTLETPATAVFCYNDMSAMGALRSINLHGWRVPQDISVVGFDDLFLASFMQPPLTTVRQPMRRMGQLAMENLLRLMSGENPVDSIRIPAELIIRESTAAPREK